LSTASLMGGLLWFLSSVHDDDDVVDDDDDDDAFRLRNAPSSRTFLVNIAAVASSLICQHGALYCIMGTT
jgi:hypothetical protein